MRISDWSSDVYSSDLMRDLARLIGEVGAGATVVLGGRVELGESAMQVATALEQFALLGVVFDGDGVDRVILRIAQLQSAYLAHQRRTVSMTAVHAVATEAAPFVIAMIGRRAAAVLAGTVGGQIGRAHV